MLTRRHVELFYELTRIGIKLLYAFCSALLHFTSRLYVGPGCILSKVQLYTMYESKWEISILKIGILALSEDCKLEL